MDTGRRQHLQDIYSSDRTARDDYTPQVSNEILEERKREMRRHQFTSFVLGMTVLVIAVSLAGVVIWQYRKIQKAAEKPAVIAQNYIPRSTLPEELQWVRDKPRNFGDPTWNGEGERPFNAQWLLKAAANIIDAQAALERSRTDTEALRDAASRYEDALEIFPDLEGVKVPLGMIYFELKEYDKALDLLEDTPENELTFGVLNNLGAACTQAEQYERAEDYLKRSLVLNPGFPPALANLARLYERQNRREEAINTYIKYLDFKPMDSDTRYDFALYMIKTDNWELAAVQLRILTKEITNDAVFYELLARAENKLGNAEGAMTAMRRAARLRDPKAVLSWMNEDEFDQLRGTEQFQALQMELSQEPLPVQN